MFLTAKFASRSASSARCRCRGFGNANACCHGTGAEPRLPGRQPVLLSARGPGFAPSTSRTPGSTTRGKS
jgi:hypothetical protein